MARRIFTAPCITDLGSVAALTQGGSDGEFTDRDFPANTPIGKLTLS